MNRLDTTAASIHEFSDLSFIKSRLRYPVSKRTIIPVILGLLTLLSVIFFVCMFFSLLGEKKFSNSVPSDYLLAVVLISLITLPYIVLARRIISNIRFKVTKSSYTQEEHIRLLIQFFSQKGISVFQHPLHKEVFQITSIPLDGYKEVRQVMVFIADDNRVLSNAHLTYNGTVKHFKFSKHAVSDAQIISELKAFINDQYQSQGKAVVKR